MEDKDNLNNENDKEKEAEGEEEDSKSRKSRKKSKSKDKKDKKRGKSKNKSKKEEEEDKKEPAKEEEDDMEIEGGEEQNEDDKEGLEVIKEAVEPYISQMKDKKTADLWKDLIYKGINNCKKPDNWFWNHLQNWMFVHCGEYYYDNEETNKDFKEIEALKHLAFFTLTYYYEDNKKKNKPPVYITVMWLYFSKQVKIKGSMLKYWVLLNQLPFRQYKNIVCGNFANRQINHCNIKIVDEKLIPQGKDKLIEELNFKAKNYSNKEFNVL